MFPFLDKSDVEYPNPNQFFQSLYFFFAFSNFSS